MDHFEGPPNYINTYPTDLSVGAGPAISSNKAMLEPEKYSIQVRILFIMLIRVAWLNLSGRQFGTILCQLLKTMHDLNLQSQPSSICQRKYLNSDRNYFSSITYFNRQFYNQEETFIFVIILRSLKCFGDVNSLTCK